LVVSSRILEFYDVFIQILAPNADAEGQNPYLTGFASLRQDWHIKKCESESEKKE